jgi:hypothetical protein
MANDEIVGQRIVDVRALSDYEADLEGWDLDGRQVAVLVLENGMRLYPATYDTRVQCPSCRGDVRIGLGVDVGCLYGITADGLTKVAYMPDPRAEDYRDNKE